MKINLDAIKTLELKLAEYAEANGTIAEHESANMNSCPCAGQCNANCEGSCRNSCGGTCKFIAK